ncbi:MAG TPA: hypothetical protein ENJ95_02130 [Bacteroidetes bacterium]|nr:hypothetical protein [Bacteroidota bacterium]
MQVQNISRQYKQRQQKFSEEAQTLRKKYDRYSIVRLLVFIVSVGTGIFLASVHWLLLAIFVLLFLGGFYRLMQWHLKMLRDAKHLERLAEINGEEDAALNHDYSSFPSGGEYLDTDHPYALDLDIYGEHSFFQYCCRATTVIGRQRLATYLAKPTIINEIKKRQEAISELNPKLNWRQHFRAYGSEVKDDPRHLKMLDDWLKDEDIVRGNGWLKAALWLAPVWFFISVLLWVFYLPWQVFLLVWLIPPAYVLKITKEKIDRTHLRTTYAGEMLLLYAGLLQHIEKEDFNSEKLAALKAPLLINKETASRQIKKLSYIIKQLNVRYNVFAIFLNLIGLWDLYWVYRLEKWKAELKGELPVWFEALCEFEVLSSLANIWYNNPGWILPEINESVKFETVELGHPLIHAGQRICNDLNMPVRGHIKLITGSNMAGKSTFLRTVGLNIVLAQMGAPVCAKKMTLPPLQVYSSMRTVDALHESTSSFYAELKRLKTIIDAVKNAASEKEGELPVFFLLDEILKGTNSVDRHTGSAALIRQLIHLKGGGLIATHDLELGRLEAESAGAIENLCMEVEVKNGELGFDYKLKKGVSKSFNATLLMRRMGIDVEVR